MQAFCGLAWAQRDGKPVAPLRRPLSTQLLPRLGARTFCWLTTCAHAHMQILLGADIGRRTGPALSRHGGR